MGIFQSINKRMYYFVSVFTKEMQQSKAGRIRGTETKIRYRQRCSTYRPVSLLNSDLKILAKTLASRLSPLVTKLIHPDQTGFIQNRHSFHNVRHLFNNLYSPRHPKEDLFILSLDAEKAFDCVEFPYL